MMHRREFMATGGLLAATVAVAPRSLPAVLRPRRPAQDRSGLRTITYNVLACRGYPTTGDNRLRLTAARPQMTARIAHELALYEPHIVSFQESPSEALVADIATRLGMRHAYFPGGFPGAILTAGDIVESRNCPVVEGTDKRGLFTRHWGRGVVRIGGERIVVYTAHLHPGNVETRAREVTAMLAVMKDDLASGQSMILQGDLNYQPDGPEYPRWSEAGLADTFKEKGRGSPYTIPSTTADRKRIDYVWAHGPIADGVQECRVLFEGAFRTNPADPRSFALSDHLPVIATFHFET